MTHPQTDDEFIGTAKMLENGTISMKLRAVGDGVVGVGTLTYEKQHPNYAEILQHLGPMKPGDEVMVRPFPD
jgi:hypothetical protein